MAQLVDVTRLRALLGLRARLTWRQYAREPGRLLTGIIVILSLTPVVIGIGIATAAGYLALPDPWPAQLLGGVLVFLWFIWLTFPFFIASLNEGLDLSRLMVYPLRRRELILGTLLGSLFDYPTYFMVPLFVAVLVGWGASLALPVVIIALLLCYGHMMLISQLVVAVLGGILQSRRFRDVAIIVGSLLGSSCYFLQLGFQRLVSRLPGEISEEQVLAFRPLLVLQWSPTGAAAR
ncbi:MAG: hypothetical protein L0322_04225, partial [Chloroflexi bacterium]|nr:hypothetical protein [Chloroflexota bacterium]